MLKKKLEDQLKKQVVQISEDNMISNREGNCSELYQLFVDMSTESMVESILQSLSSLDRSRIIDTASETSQKNEVSVYTFCIFPLRAADGFQKSPKAIFLCGKNDDAVSQLAHDLLDTFPTSFCRARLCKTEPLSAPERVSDDTYIVSHDDMSEMISKQRIVHVSADASGSAVGIRLEDVSSGPLSNNAVYLVPCQNPDIECIKLHASEGFKLVYVDEAQVRSDCLFSTA